MAFYSPVHTQIAGCEFVTDAGAVSGGASGCLRMRDCLNDLAYSSKFYSHTLGIYCQLMKYIVATEKKALLYLYLALVGLDFPLFCILFNTSTTSTTLTSSSTSCQ